MLTRFHLWKYPKICLTGRVVDRWFYRYGGRLSHMRIFVFNLQMDLRVIPGPHGSRPTIHFNSYISIFYCCFLKRWISKWLPKFIVNGFSFNKLVDVFNLSFSHEIWKYIQIASNLNSLKLGTTMLFSIFLYCILLLCSWIVYVITI